MFFALIGALVVGLSLGALGSGGSILTVPVLTFLVGQPEKVAIAGSLVIVGGIALVGASRAWRAGRVDLHSVLWFGVPRMGGSIVGAWLGGMVPGRVQLLVFGLVMLVGAWLMLRPMQVWLWVLFTNVFGVKRISWLQLLSLRLSVFLLELFPNVFSKFTIKTVHFYVYVITNLMFISG